MADMEKTEAAALTAADVLACVSTWSALEWETVILDLLNAIGRGADVHWVLDRLEVDGDATTRDDR